MSIYFSYVMTLSLTSHPLRGEAAKVVTYEGWEGARALDRASPALSRAEHPRDQTAMEPETRDEPEAGDEQSCTVYGLYDQDLTHKVTNHHVIKNMFSCTFR